MPEFPVGWAANGVLVIEAATPERAAELADERLHDALTDDLGVEDLVLSPREMP